MSISSEGNVSEGQGTSAAGRTALGQSTANSKAGLGLSAVELLHSICTKKKCIITIPIDEECFRKTATGVRGTFSMQTSERRNPSRKSTYNT